MTTLVDLSRALVVVGRVLRENDGRHRGAWRTQLVEEHVAHALAHLKAWQAGDGSEHHLAHGATRLLMALTLAEVGARSVDIMSHDAPDAPTATRATRVDAGCACTTARRDDPHREPVGDRRGGDPGADAEAPRHDAAGGGREGRA